MSYSSYLNVAINKNLSTVGLFVATLITVYVIHRIYKWRRNPKCNIGVLPPGSMGLPFIGETLQLIIPSPSLDLPPFIATRIKRYGSIFRTNVAGRPVIISADREFNYYILKQDETLVTSLSLDTFTEVFNQANQSSRKYTRNLTLNHFGVEALKDKLIPKMEDLIRKTLRTWSSKDTIEVKGASIKMTIDFATKQLVSSDLDNSLLKLSDMFKDFIQGLMSFPVNIPGTRHHKCKQIQKKVRETVGNVLKKRLSSSPDQNREEDLLDHLIKDMDTEKFLNEDFIVQLMFALLFVTSDSMSTTMALAFKLLEEHPEVLEELIAEHEATLKQRENLDSPLTWNEYKSMIFTRQVINEILRLANIAPGLFRRALVDIPINGYTIPKGWVILIATAAHHLDSSQFDDPMVFNPSRWKDLQSSVVSKSFMPYGFGMKQCAGAEYSRVFIATFLHVLVTKYSWRKLKGGKIVRAPILRFPDGFHYKISEKTN